MPCKIFLLFSRSKPTQSTQFKKTLFRTRIRILRSIRGRRDVRFDQKPKRSQRDPIRSHSRERLTCVPVTYVGYSDVFKKDSIISVHLAHLLPSGCRHVVCLVASSTGSLGEREPVRSRCLVHINTLGFPPFLFTERAHAFPIFGHLGRLRGSHFRLLLVAGLFVLRTETRLLGTNQMKIFLLFYGILPELFKFQTENGKN